MCPECHSLEQEFVDLAGTGTLYSYSLLHHPQHPAFSYPIIAALVDLDEGVRIVSNLVDVQPADIRIGMPLQVRFEPTDGGFAVPVFAPGPGGEARLDRRAASPQTKSVRTSAGLVGRAAIVGIGHTEYSKAANRSETRLAAEAIVAALADAGLGVEDVDGLVSYTIDPVEETELVRALGIPEIGFSSRVPYGGGGSQGVILHAAAAVASGAASVVVAYRATRSRSGARFGAARVTGRPASAHSGSTAGQWCTPFGVLTPGSWMSLNATRYMHATGATNEDFGRAVVQLREYAATNPDSHFYRRPITLDDHQASRWIAEPCIRLFDCCQETDGAAALVVTAERAPGVPVVVAAAAGAGIFEEEIATNHYRPDLAVMDGSVALGKRLFGGSGIGRDELDVALIYDAFSPILFMQLEGLGFCAFGEARDFVADGHLGPKGRLPTNTNGGLIGEGYIHGLNLTLEAVRQLRGTAVNQVEDARTALVSANRTGIILRRS
jgi:acetyl-CoA acetyltransferase